MPVTTGEMEKLMPNMLDYERLVQQVADLNVELALLKGRHQNRYEEGLRWDAIENQPEIGTLTEEKRLRRIIRQWEERYDILCELFAKARFDQKPPNWHEAVSDREYRFQREKERKAKWEYRTIWLRIVYTKIKNLIEGIKK